MASQGEWVAYQDDAGDTYYWNEELQQSSWELPSDAVAADVSSDEAAADSEVEWQFCDDQSGVPYWFNRRTGEWRYAEESAAVAAGDTVIDPPSLHSLQNQSAEPPPLPPRLNWKSRRSLSSSDASEQKPRPRPSHERSETVHSLRLAKGVLGGSPVFSKAKWWASSNRGSLMYKYDGNESEFDGPEKKFKFDMRLPPPPKWKNASRKFYLTAIGGSSAKRQRPALPTMCKGMPGLGAIAESPDSTPMLSAAASEEDEIRFQKGDLLGKGGFGKVFRAINLKNAAVFAVKEIELTQQEAEEKEHSEKIATFKKEVNLMRELRHPNILRYLGVQVKPRVIRIFLELAQDSLALMISKFHGSLHEDVVCKFTRQILQGLLYLHENHIIHRDIKGANILMGTDGNLKLADFGASTHYDELLTEQAMQSIVGTPFWMAPEVVNDVGYTAKADIWSVGCVVVEMITGQHPYANMNQFAAIFAISQGRRPEYRAELLSSDGLDFLDKCFIVDADKRWSAHQLLSHPFLARAQ